MPRVAPLPWRRLVCVFQLDGFVVARQEGDHVVMTKPGVSRPVVIPQHRAIPEFIIRNNMRTAGMSRERYFQLLEKC